MQRSTLPHRVAFLVLAFMTLASRTYTQTPQGQILGKITDVTGAVIPGANLTLENQLTGIKQTTVTNDNGDYAFSNLNSGIYRVSVEKSGFKTGVYNEIRVQVAEKKRVDVQLEVGEVTAKVEVMGAAALIETDTSTVGTIVSQREVTEIPLNGRDFSQLALLTPGVRPAGTNYTSNMYIQVGGTPWNKNSYTINGIDNTLDIFSGPSIAPSIDAIQEFRIDRSQFTAEYGRGGAEIHVLTKSGTNDWHGAVWEYLRNYALNAGNYITHEQDSLKRNQYGFNLGGPIVKSKAFFFFNWEGQRQRSTSQLVGSVFTDKMRTGDLSEFPDPIIDPLTGQPFPGNVIHADRLDPVSVDYMNALFPRANQPGVASNVVRRFITRQDWDQYTARVDYQPSSKDTLFFHLLAQPRSGTSEPYDPSVLQGLQDNHLYNGGIGWNRSWTPRTTTETRLGLRRERLLAEPIPPDQLPSTNIRGLGGHATRLPYFFISPYYFFDSGFIPISFSQRAFDFSQNIGLVRGNHLLKAGFVGRYQKSLEDQFPERWPRLQFFGTYTGNGVADYLLGYPFYQEEWLSYYPKGHNYGDYSAFFHDDWKVTPWLTLNLGLRYDLLTLPVERRDQYANWTPSMPDKIILAGDSPYTPGIPDQVLLDVYKDYYVTASQAGLPKRTLGFGDHNNFAPRFGFAWRPFKDNKTVFRGGYGIFYILEDGNHNSNPLFNPPYWGSVFTLNTTPLPSVTIADPWATGPGSFPNPVVYARDAHMRSSYMQQISLGIQRELPWGMVGEVNFQDQNSKKLESSYNFNQPPPGPGDISSRIPFPAMSSFLWRLQHDGYARYDALELVVRKTSAHYTFQWSHTWAKNLQRDPSFWVGAYYDIINPYDLGAFYGPVNYVPHLDKLHFILDLPVGKGRRLVDREGVLNAVLGGWTVSGFATLYQSGDPLTVTWSGDPANVGSFNSRPDRVKRGKIDSPTAEKWFDTSAFVAPAPGTFGNSGTGILFGPSRKFFDFGIYKNFAIREGIKLQFRTEMFNAFNHPNQGNPLTLANAPAFGRIPTKLQTPRVIQFALRLTF